MTETYVELVSKDNQVFKVSKDVISQSSTIKALLEKHSDDDTPRIHFSNFDSAPLAKSIEYMEQHHKNMSDEIFKPLPANLDSVLSAWDKQFLQQLDQGQLIEVVMVANFLNIKSLLNLTTAKIAILIKGKSPTEIRQIFDIENDLTQEEEQKIKEENKWCEDAC